MTYLLLINTLLGILWQPLVYADFKIRQDYIARVLCINKDKPITVCGGSCVLADRLTKIEPPSNQDKPRENQINRQLEINFFAENKYTEIPRLNWTFLEQNEYISLIEATRNGFPPQVFPPPQV